MGAGDQLPRDGLVGVGVRQVARLAAEAGCGGRIGRGDEVGAAVAASEAFADDV